MSWKFDPFIPPHPPTSSEVGFFVFRKEDASRHPLFSACQKSLAEFAARRRQRNKIIFSRDMCVRENTARAASVEFVRHRRTNYARSRPQAFCRKNPEGFSTVSKKRTPLGILFFYTLESLENYFSSTLAPTSSSSFFMFSASSLDRASFRVVGVSSTAFLASARPRPVISRTDLMTLIF